MIMLHQSVYVSSYYGSDKSSSQKGETTNLNHRASFLMNLIPYIMVGMRTITITSSATKNLLIQKNHNKHITNGHDQLSPSTNDKVNSVKDKLAAEFLKSKPNMDTKMKRMKSY